MDTGTGMVPGTEKVTVTHTRHTHIRLPGGYTIPISITSGRSGEAGRYFLFLYFFCYYFYTKCLLLRAPVANR